MIRVGVVGLGEIAQVMHLPYLAASPDFEVAAACDLSRELLEHADRTYGIPTLTTDYEELLEHVDAVAILTLEHAEIAETALAAGKHVFVEKPLGYSLESCERITRAVAASSAHCMIGYMRRWDPAYRAACELRTSLEGITLVRVHDFRGAYTVHSALYDLRHPSDLADEIRTGVRDRVESDMQRALGPSHEHLTELYFGVLMSGIHDLSMLRGLFGEPEQVVSSTRLAGNGLVSIIRYPGEVTVSFEINLHAGHTWWDQDLWMYGADQTIGLQFPNPFIRNAPTVLTVQRQGQTPSRSRGPVSYESPYELEWRHFAECIRDDLTPLANVIDAYADVALGIDIVKALPATTEDR